jgi:hypothetical protein
MRKRVTSTDDFFHLVEDLSRKLLNFGYHKFGWFDTLYSIDWIPILEEQCTW